VTRELWDNGQQFTYTYDENSNRLTADDGNIKYVYTYDYTDLLETVDRLQTLNPTVSFKYQYDKIGNLIQADELIGNATQPQATTIYEYNDPRYLNTKISQTGVGLATKDVKFTYDPTGLNTRVERDVDGLLKVKTTNAYDLYGRLTGIEHRDGANVIIGSSSYLIDNLDRLKTETVDGQIRTIGYDSIDQVKTVTGSNSEAYTYDLNGNRINAGYTIDPDNRLRSDGTYNYLYDPEGNRTKRTEMATGIVDNYTWDYRNRLVSIVTVASGGAVLETVEYEYDANDQRVRKRITSALPTSGVVENYFIDRDQIAFVTDGSGIETFHYLYGLNVDAVMAQDSPAGMVWSLADRLGSIDLLTDANGVVVDKRSFDSFGRVLSETNPSVSFRYGYTGRERDLESGLSYYRARYYDPNVGRFISVDPIGFAAGDTNLYRYVGNSSTNAIDPSGELAWFVIPAIVAVGGALLGAYQNYSYQSAQVADRKQAEIDPVNVVSSGAWGAVGATAGLALATFVPQSIPFLAGAGLFSAAQNTQNAITATAANEPNTAEYYRQMAYLDLFGALTTKFNSPTPPSMQSAMALVTSGANALSGAFVGGSLFQHFFAMTNGEGGNEGNNNGGGKSTSEQEVTEQMVKSGLSQKQAQATVNKAIEANLFPELETIVRSGKLTNPESLLNHFGKATSTKNTSKHGTIGELRALVAESKNADSITFGQNGDMTVTNGSTVRTIQVKTVNSPKQSAFTKNLTEAANQLSGSKGEKPAAGSTREIRIQFLEGTYYYDKDSSIIGGDVNTYLSDVNKQTNKPFHSSVDKVTVVNKQGIQEYQNHNGSFSKVSNK
jgi:RHS repeat-associated protein